MSKYLELFLDSFDDSIIEKTKLENKPYVGYSLIDGIAYTTVPKPIISGPWVTFTAEEDNSSIGLMKKSASQTLEYSTDTTTWSKMSSSTTITLANNGDKVYIRGVLSRGSTVNSNYTQFKMSGKIAASGNCNALWNYQDLNARLKTYCGYYMFANCTSLTTAPELPATTLTKFCYYGMFKGCTKLNYIKCLATDISAVADTCTNYWVEGVSSTGTFIKHPDMNDWTTGDKGTPSGWDVVDAEI